MEMFDEFDNRKLTETQRGKLKSAFEELLGEGAVIACFADNLIAIAPSLKIEDALKE